ncbi:UvrD-helicase domain-containing protein, partial [Brevibacillus laterosporus]|uniref:UvrD-helicase domain-containing protein n=1 Tax=Brevibacillus laterosporus TaxID=1465 RepID=UPI00113FF142
MAEEKLEVEVELIFECIKNKENFLLSGGAGSGKTYSLVQVIRKAINDNPLAKVACITYTNAAVKEIVERVDHQNLWVATIHDFLWDNIKFYQRDLKRGLIDLINDEESKIVSPDGTVDKTYFDYLKDGIQYKEYNRIKEGIISHDEVLALANVMFKKNSLLCDILKDKYKFIFIDEYQDTSPLVVEIFMEHLTKSKKQNIIGFFGDAMQSIYDDGIGELKKYIESGEIKEVQKKQNRRNPKLVIELANKLRFDGLVQEPSIDPKAPNIVNGTVKEGNIKFLYSTNGDLEEIKQSLYFEGWDFNNSKQTKELYLTHNLIATKVGFPNLMEIYDKDPIIGLKN